MHENEFCHRHRFAHLADLNVQNANECESMQSLTHVSHQHKLTHSSAARHCVRCRQELLRWFQKALRSRLPVDTAVTASYLTLMLAGGSHDAQIIPCPCLRAARSFRWWFPTAPLFWSFRSRAARPSPLPPPAPLSLALPSPLHRDHASTVCSLNCKIKGGGDFRILIQPLKADRVLG